MRRDSGGQNSAGQVTAWAVPSLTCAGEGRTAGRWGQPGGNESIQKAHNALCYDVGDKLLHRQK